MTADYNPREEEEEDEGGDGGGRGLSHSQKPNNNQLDSYKHC